MLKYASGLLLLSLGVCALAADKPARTGVSASVTSPRTAFLRMEQGQPVQLTLSNNTGRVISNGSARVSLAGSGEKVFALGAWHSGADKTIDYTIDTGLRAGEYALIVQMFDGARVVGRSQSMIDIVNRQPPRMGATMWGAPKGKAERDLVKKLGFTGYMGLIYSPSAIVQSNGRTWITPKDLAANAPILNEALKEGMTLSGLLNSGYRWHADIKRNMRVGRDGQPLKDANVDGLYPEVQEFFHNTGEGMGRGFGQFPSALWAVVSSEDRDNASPAFNEIDRKTYREFSGHDIPAEVHGKQGIKYERLRDFPADRVIDDDHPLYVYYKWYWTVGDGWNILNDLTAKGLRDASGGRILSDFSPAVRTPSIYGSAAQSDYIGNWTYVYPDPIKISLTTDELLCMAGGPEASKHHQKVTGGPQIIMYRNQVTGAKKVASAFDDHDFSPGIRFITVAPTLLSEGVWCNLARPVNGFYFHGWSSLVPVDEQGSAYKYTNPQTQNTMSDLLHNVIRPLGPTLLQVPDVKSDVAYLESFASQMFAGRGTYGWSDGWGADAYLMLLYAQIQPHIVYEQTIQADGLDGCKVLVLANCDVLPRSVVEKIQAFQKKGGLVVADDRTCPAIKPDIRVQSYNRVGRADKDKAMLLQLAARLKAQLTGKYEWIANSINPQVITRRRKFGTTDYLFAINDHRTFGRYIGQYGMVMEDGLPSRTTVTFKRDGGFVYDLLRHERVKTTSQGGTISIPLDLEAGSGRALAILDHEPEKLALDAAGEAKRGDKFTCEIALLDTTGAAVDAVVPMQVKVIEPGGAEGEYSGYYGAAGGKLTLQLDIASNDRVGQWRIEATEGLSGIKNSVKFSVK